MITASAIERIVDTIKKSNTDKWNYRGLELTNGMLCVLISHPNIDKAAAALDVGIGSFANPDNVPGIAHFLEHMLFMGSTKYPDENEYAKLIQSNGGYWNAYTTGKQTNYYFDINPTFLSEALDVFAHFFISPLFLSSSVDRELQAINSEFEGNLSQDAWRIRQIKRTTSDPKHPYSKFSTGNIESLRTTPTSSGIDVRQVLLDFYEKEYSANRMSLVVLGNQSLDELQSMVMKSFKDVPNKQLNVAYYPADPFGETRCKTISYIVPIAEYRDMTITWMVADHREIYYCNPESYVSFLIHHKGIGSPLFHLKKLGLALELYCSWDTDCAPGFSFFEVAIKLTIEGLKRWKDIVYVLYQYMAMMRQEGPKEWIFDERKNMRMMNFQFRDKYAPARFVSDLAGQLRDYPLTECLFGKYDMREFRPDLVQELLEKYLIPSRMRIFLISKDFSTIATEKEKWYGIPYKQEYLPEEFIEKCETCDLNVDLHLPLPNNFIPNDFRLYHSEQDNPVASPQLPRKIQENEFYRLYYSEDTFYKLPKAFLYFDIRNPLAYVDPIHRNMNKLYIALVKDSLSDYVYPAQLGGLAYDLFSSFYGVELSINGYNQKIPVLLEAIIERMINLKVDPQRFEILKENEKQSLENFRRQEPYTMTRSGITYLIGEHQWHSDELLSCLAKITPQDIQVFSHRFLAHFYVDSFMYGNLTETQSVEYMMMFQQKFQQHHLFRPIYPSMWFNQRQLMLPDGCNYAYTRLNDGHRIQAIRIYLQCFQQNLENNALLDLFADLVKELCFNQLRTKEQLGYVVISSASRAFGAQGFQIVVQSTYELDYVNRRIELFLDSIRDYIEQMSDEEFQKHREGCIVKKMEIPKKMESQGGIIWDEIDSHQFCFNRSRLESDIMKMLGREDIIRFYDHYISPRSPYRRKLTLFVKPSPVALANAPFEKDINEKPPTLEEEKLKGSELFQRLTSYEECHLAEPKSLDTVPNLTKNRKLVLPEVIWIDNALVWKSQLSCYPLAPMYEKITVPILHKL